jgi:hypothetical protein
MAYTAVALEQNDKQGAFVAGCPAQSIGPYSNCRKACGRTRRQGCAVYEVGASLFREGNHPAETQY